MMDDLTRGGNWKSVVLAVLITGLLTAVGVRMVWNAQKVVIAKSEVYRELVNRKTLTRERDELMRQVAELKAATRMEVRARIMNLTVPEGENVIVVEPEKGK